jgi:hypothetical protein
MVITSGNRVAHIYEQGVTTPCSALAAKVMIKPYLVLNQAVKKLPESLY